MMGSNRQHRIRESAQLAIAFALASALIGCTASSGGTKAKPAVPEGGVLLQGAGATFPSVLYKKWFAEYRQSHPTTVVSYDAVGSGEGVRRFVAKGVKDEEKVDFGASDAAMRDEDMSKVPAGAILVPVTAGEVALAYNLPELRTDLKLSRPAYSAIFLGQIKNWDDPRITKTNPGVKLPHLTITTVVRHDSSGTTFAFTKHLDSISDTFRSQYGPATLVNWPGNAMRASGNEGVAGRIKQSLGSIGYVGVEFARKVGLPMALLENREGKFVAPTEEAGIAALASAELPDNLRAYVPDPAGADSYPIVTLTWILLYQRNPDAQKARALHELFRWCLTDGQKDAPELGYLSLPPNIAMKSLARLDAIQPTAD